MLQDMLLIVKAPTTAEKIEAKDAADDVIEILLEKKNNDPNSD